MIRSLLIFGWIVTSVGFEKNLQAQTNKPLPLTADMIEKVSEVVAVSDDQSRMLKRWLSDKRVTRLKDTFSLNVEASLQLTHDRYGHFLEPFAINLLRKFCAKWARVLAKAEEKFQVDKEVIASILLVETGYGRLAGNYSVLAVFASIILDTQDLIEGGELEKFSERMQIRVYGKNQWAKEEVKALLQMGKYWNIVRLKGSFAGAFGIPQFLPSSYIKWAIPYRVGEKGEEKKPNLFWPPDAIYSAGNYLMAHGYKKDGDIEKNRQSIFAYNRSQVYVDTILSVASKAKSQ